MERGELMKEYESIPRRRPAGECTIAQLQESGDKNRFQDVLPYDDTRVELVPTKENNTGYINASHIRVSCSETHYHACVLWFSLVRDFVSSSRRQKAPTVECSN